MIYGDLTLSALASGVTLEVTTEKGKFLLKKQSLRRFRFVTEEGWPFNWPSNVRYLLRSCDIRTVGWGRLVVGKRFSFLVSGHICVTTKIVKIERVWEGQ